ncbi:MAG: ATPase [Alphaproteobacteria bacterium]|nr:MAG: ATPase [Alphaproteobacteria bacterium]
MAPRKPHVIVLGNEKGGTGKSTISMHIIVQLLRQGHTVGSIDVDARQGTLTRYIDNRRNHALAHHPSLPMPEHVAIHRSDQTARADAESEESARFSETIKMLAGNNFIVIDTAGNDTFLSRLSHAHAHTLITPMNDSFVDLDLLVRIEINDKDRARDSMRPSTYAEAVWNQKKQRLSSNQPVMDWIVLRNRLSHIQARNKIEMARVLEALAGRIGFRVAEGFTERVIFRELFLSGLTLLDMHDANKPLSASHVAARQELRNLIKALDLPDLSQEVPLEGLKVAG